jgi:putative membrane-bound dehydrogenase-like protein
MYRTSLRRGLRWSLAALFGFLMMTGPGGEARAELPKVPDEFAVRLVAAVPAVQFPCQVATAPDGALFVGEDPMDQVGPADRPIDRILLFRDGKDPVVYAEKLNAVFGMVWHDGALYVMNMPRLTVFRDRDGDGKADERKDIFTDLGVPAGSPNDFNDHIVSGLKIGIDRYLYISVGDKGVPRATGPDGRTAQVRGGGVLRCRLDGTGLEVFSTGTRNHLEPNLDDRDNLFTYDNTDDGLGWWTRVTHHIDGGYYGYPFDYHTRTARMLPRMAEYGGGSPCGGLFYGEDAWPEKYRGLLFWAEWGQRVVRAIRFEPAGSTFKVAEKIDFVEHGKVDDFRPLDLALSHDGKTMYIADWSTGSWGNKTEKLGRVYAVTYKGKTLRSRRRGQDSDPVEAQIKQLGHPSFNERFRAQTALTRAGKGAVGAVTAALADSGTALLAKRHLVWVLDAVAGGTPEASYPLVDALKSPSRDVRAQAARALGERAVPIALEPLIKRLRDGEPSVKLQALIALGRIGSPESIPGVLPLVAETDVFVAYAARRALQRIGDWSVAARGLDSPDPKVRAGTLLAMDQVYDAAASSRLAEFAASAKRPVEERLNALEYLSEVDRKSPPWDGKWWGTQPAKGKPPARTIAWADTPRVMATCRALATDPLVAVRTRAVEALGRLNDSDSAPFLRGLFPGEHDPGVKSAIALALGKRADIQALDLLTSALRDDHGPESVRDAALVAVEMIGTQKAAIALADLLGQNSVNIDRQPRVIRALGRFKDVAAIKPLLESLKSQATPVRAAAIDALVAIVKRAKDRGRDDVAAGVRALLADPTSEVRNRAIAATGAIGDRQAIPALMALAEKPESRFEAGLALAKLPDIRALQLYLHGLAEKNSELRKASAAAITALRDPAATVLEQLAKRNELSPAVLPELRSIFAGLVPITTWNVLGSFPITGGPSLDPLMPVELSATFKGVGGKPVTWKTATAVDHDGQIDLGRVYTHDDDRLAYGYAEITSSTARTAPTVVGSDDTLTVWVNGKQVYNFTDRRGFSHDSARFDLPLTAGTNRIMVRCGNRGGPWQFSVAVTAPADYAFLKAPVRDGFDPEAYRAFALNGQGSASHGRLLFSDLKGLACVKCHAVGKEGGSVGPELSTVGAKYPRDELIASVLYPSAKISSGFEPTTFALVDGRVVTGIVRTETDGAVEIQDAEARLVRFAKDEIDERKRGDVSVMPTGLAAGLSRQDFADLIAYLETLKNVDSKSKLK